MRALRKMVTLVGVSVLLTGCGSDNGTSTSPSPSEPSATVSATPSPEPVSPLEGTWQTAPLSRSDAEETLREFALERWIERFRGVTPIVDDTVLILQIGEQWDLYRQVNGGPREEVDFNAEYGVKGNEVVVTHSTGSNTFRWSIDGDRLALEWVQTTIPPSDGVPEEVFQRALYMTGEFERES